MATMVLVHGIAQEQRSADDLEAEWLPAIAGGVRNAGHGGVADRIWPMSPGERLARMAFYGNLFLDPDQQGFSFDLSLEPDRPEAGTDLSSSGGERLEAADEMAVDFLTNALDSTRPRDAGTAELELQALNHPEEDEQGLGRLGGRALAALEAIPWLGSAGFHLTGRHRLVGQAVRYLTEPAVREAALDSFYQHLTPETRVVIAHSLGSVVAYEGLRARPQDLRLLITLGSPLGLRSVTRRLLQPAHYPTGVRRWINLADRDDIVAARPTLTRIFDFGRPAGANFDSTYTVDNGAAPHTATFYLTKRTTGDAVATALP